MVATTTVPLRFLESWIMPSTENAKKAAKETGGYRSRTGDFNYKLLIFLIYGAHELSYVQRDRHVFSVWKKPLMLKFDKSAPTVLKTFRTLEDCGYIYNLSFTQSYIKFCFNPPPWLTFSEKERKMRDTTIANPALIRDLAALSEWGKTLRGKTGNAKTADANKVRRRGNNTTGGDKG